ncbi:hypothetical protein KY290_036783 [Solanum tuberosum]|uniref:DUF4283 domain-containing protein n=1 Tax=Solanum tuberosum TaxID=4113 RepID=A0ABQ7TVR3_SOLTU|nr:hypothetical protein KY290_036783 [Solanum tuberosum]
MSNATKKEGGTQKVGVDASSKENDNDLVKEEQVSPLALNRKLNPEAPVFVPKCVIAKKNESRTLASNTIDLAEDSLVEDEEDNIHYITPATGIPRNLLSITFGSNLPPEFKTISEEDDTSSLEEEVHFGDYNFQMLKLSLIQLQQLGKSGEIREVLSLIPLWVKFPRLHVGYWSIQELSNVDGAMGQPLHTGNFTANVEKISFANILIEVDVSEPFPDMIVIETPSGPWDQPVECDWRPKYCNECLKFGHNDVECCTVELQQPHDVLKKACIISDDPPQKCGMKIMVSEDEIGAGNLMPFVPP